MKHLITLLGILSACSIFIPACKKDNQQQTDSSQTIPQTIVERIKADGFSTYNIRKVAGGYVVEGDIFLSDEVLKQKTETRKVTIAKEEQYRTTNLIAISNTREITVSVTGLPPAYTTATDEAIARYNALGLRLTFRRVASNGEVNIVNENLGTGVLGQSAGFPTAQGNPPSPIKLNGAFIGSTPDQGYLATIIAHEIGHTIGLRHTDYMDRTYSCGWGGNEGDGGVGVFHIPGTPSSPDANSWMLACTDGNNRPFNANDIVALNYLYGTASDPIPDGIYKVTCVGSGKVLDVDASRLYENAANVQQYEYGGAGNQRWTFQYLGNGCYLIACLASGKVLDVDASRIYQNGANVQQYDWGGAYNQQWILKRLSDGSYAILNRQSGKCLDVEDYRLYQNAANVQQYDFGGASNQRWYIQAP